MALQLSVVPDAIIVGLLQLAEQMPDCLRSCLQSRGQPVGLLPDVSPAERIFFGMRPLSIWQTSPPSLERGYSEGCKFLRQGFPVCVSGKQL